MKVALGTFACFCIEARCGPNVAIGIRAALRSYVRGLESASPPVALPEFCRTLPPDSSRVEFELAVEPEIETALEREARRQAVQLEQLLNHAVFVYLARAEESSGRSRYRGDAPLFPQ